MSFVSVLDGRETMGLCLQKENKTRFATYRTITGLDTVCLETSVRRLVFELCSDNFFVNRPGARTKEQTITLKMCQVVFENEIPLSVSMLEKIEQRAGSLQPESTVLSKINTETSLCYLLFPLRSLASQISDGQPQFFLKHDTEMQII